MGIWSKSFIVWYDNNTKRSEDILRIRVDCSFINHLSLRTVLHWRGKITSPKMESEGGSRKDMFVAEEMWNLSYLEASSCQFH